MNNQVELNVELQNKAAAISKEANLNQSGALSIGKLRTIMDASVNRQQSQGLNLPPDYSVSNALTAAFLRLQTVESRSHVPALQCCTPNSIIQSLMNMVTQGLSPAKDQCYFIVYGHELQMRRSYFGTVAALLRLNNIKDVDAQVIYEGDRVTTTVDEHGHLVLDTKNTSLDWTNQDNEMLGAYAVVTTSDGVDHLTIMTAKQIKVSWSQAQTDKVQKKFGSEMAKRTVLNRAAKLYVNTSDDSDLLTGAINDTTSNEFDDDERRDVTPEGHEDQTQAIIDKIGSNTTEEDKKPEKAPDNKNNDESKVTGKKHSGGDKHDDSSEDEEYPVVDGQTDLFDPETVKPKAAADAE